MSAFLAIYARTWRSVLRRPVVLMLSFAQPVIWMLFFGFLFQRFDVSGIGPEIRYIDFVAPGMCMMSVLLGASQSGVSYIRDLHSGMYERMLATPAARWEIFGGKICADVSRLLLQAIVVALIAVLLGARFRPDAGATLVALAAVALFAVAYAGLSVFIAIRTRAQESMAALIHLVNLPLLFTSTALVPTRQMPDWLAAIAAWNPLSLVVDLLRSALL